MSDPSKNELLIKLNQKELNAKIAEYEQWRKSAPPEGARFPLNKLDLRGLTFSKRDLIYLDLSGSDLSGVDLTRAHFSDSNLTQANLSEANLTRATFERSVFTNADLTKAKLTDAYLSWSDFINAKLIAADLSGAYLRNTNLTDADLAGATLTGTDFASADLSRANFSNATLTNARFCKRSDANHGEMDGGATLVETKFLNGKMHGADLRETLTAGMQLGGADVTNAKLPEEIKAFEGLKTVEEASKITKRLFTMLLSGLGLSILTIFSTRDVALLTNSTTSPLPIIQTPIPLASFYWVAPILLAAFFAYFLLNLLHLYQLISKLPAVFPDGAALDEKIYPWLLNTLVREHFPILDKKKISFFWLRKLLIVILVFWTTPIILFGFWARYLPRHDFGWSVFQIILIGLTTFWTIEAKSNTIQTLKNSPGQPHPMKYFYQLLGMVFSFMLPLYITNYTAQEDLVKNDILGDIGKYNWQGAGKDYFNAWLRANLADQEVSHKPENWNKDKPTEGVKGAELEGANLDYANAEGAFLVKAKLSNSSLKHARLTKANLAEAVVAGYGTDLTRARLNRANLAGANLGAADLDGVDFNKANLNGTSLIGSRNMKPNQIKKAKNWQLAIYDENFQYNELHLMNEDVKAALCSYLAKENPKLSDIELGELYNQEVEKYQKYYGEGFVTPKDKPCKKTPASAHP